MEKRLFQTLDEMNIADGENNTGNVGVCYDLVGAQKVKQGGHVTMGVPESVVLDLLLDKDKIPILLIVNKAEYEKVRTTPQACADWKQDMLDELGSNNVADICFADNKWTVKYKNHLPEDVFDSFSEMYSFLESEGSDN